MGDSLTLDQYVGFITGESTDAIVRTDALVRCISDPDRRILFEQALKIQKEIGGFRGAQYLFGPSGLAPHFWGVSKQQLTTFRAEVSTAISEGRIKGATRSRDGFPLSTGEV